MLWWIFKATERLHWLTPKVFFRLPREEQILILVYARERDEEEWESATMLALANLVPVAAGPGKE